MSKAKVKRPNAYLSDKQIEMIKSKLLSEKEKLLIKDQQQEDFCLAKDELSDVLDEASVNIEASKMLRFRNRELFYLKKINKSLQRIAEGTYGLCEECDSEISYERLVARPTAELCIACKEEAEMDEKNSLYQKRSKSLGQTMSDVVLR